MSFDPVQPFVIAINRIFGATTPVAVNKIRSYPAIIRLLQDFKFDQTEHPPSNFDIVYACAVIKYGELNQYEALVELFLKEEIKKAFDQAFYQNNYAKVIEVIEQTVNWQEQDWNTLGEQIKGLNIDFVPELEVFKSEFIKLVKLSQTVAQRLTDQKIEELHDKVDNLTQILTPPKADTLTQQNYLYPEEFQPLIKEKISSFCGRKFVFTAFANFLKTHPKGYFTVIGDAGMGKSAIVAKYVDDHKTIHYFNVLQEGRNTPESFLKSIRQQLINRYNLQNAETDDLSALLVKVSPQINADNPLVIVVDALDEVEQKDTTKNILELPKTLPDNVYFLLTRRRYEEGKERLFTEGVGKEKLDLTANQYKTDNRHDIQNYIRFFLNHDPEHQAGLKKWIADKKIADHDFIEQVAAKSENNFMYLRYVLPGIAQGFYNDLTLKQLPQGLQQYYATHWARMGMDNKPQEMKVIILFILVEIGTPIPCEMIAEIAKHDEVEVQQVLNEWFEYLKTQNVDGDECYSIYHASFLDFIQTKRELKSTRKLFTDVNQRIVDYWENP